MNCDTCGKPITPTAQRQVCGKHYCKMCWMLMKEEYAEDVEYDDHDEADMPECVED